MFGIIFSFVASQILYFALHLESSSFPKPLSARDEIAAFEAMKNGDMAARDKLIRHNLRLVAHIVKKYYASSTDQEDLISIGTVSYTHLLVVADASRTEKTICLAVSPSLKSYGIPGRARLFEVVRKVKQANAQRQQSAPGRRFTGSSASAIELRQHPELYRLHRRPAPYGPLYGP